MFDEVERVKERRRERMDRLRTQTRDGYSPFVDDWKDSLDLQTGAFPFSSQRDDAPFPHLPLQEKLGIQLFVSVLLIGVAYLLFHSSFVPTGWKESAREVMTRDFNFEGAAAWYESRFGELPAVLPALSTTNKSVPASTAEGTTGWKMAWKMVKPFEPTNAKIVVNTGIDGKATVGETGWVTYIGEKPGYGSTVIVRLTKGREIWYGNLEQIQVALNDWLQPGQVVGVARKVNDTSRYLHLGVRQNEQFINPLEVISLD
ncbi:peptidoglycan DD-metalloendopeptidase family protein [Brevibacillus sp. H7]|jgi:stage IV sporulation protein FA|uniref:peptidoglycan DD-metalloendopeptidase family protein n=1 Tax=Brevibacillus sp. H7 TaxID=3349138 RepID=UPI0038071C60